MIKLSNHYYTFPIGIRNSEVPLASKAEAETSRDLVGDGEADSGFFRALEQYGISLNRPQMAAVRHQTGAALTLAGAGSGKTSVLVCRTAYLVAVRHVQPQHILLMTFSKKAADEMRSRIRSLPVLDAQAASGVEARTFHSFCLQLLRGRGYRQSILGETGQKHIFFKRLMRELLLQNDYEPETLLAQLSAIKLRMLSISELPETTTEERELKLLFTRYEQWKKELDKLDYDDLLLETFRLLRDDETLLATLQRRFQYIMIDEFQDTNQVQYVIVQMLADKHRNLMVVGDDDQTIYSFNGAKNDYILNFEQQYPGASTIVLDINYRSTSTIVGLGNAIIQYNKQRKEKTLLAVKSKGINPAYARLKSTQDEAQLVVEKIIEQTGQGKWAFGDFAVLFRTASSSRALVELLLTKQLPFIDYGDGQLFYDQWAIKPLVAHLRLFLDRRNFDAIEALLPSLYINREQAMAFIWNQDKQRAKKWPLIHLLDFPQLKDFQKDKIKERIKLIKSFADSKPADAVMQLRQAFYDQYLETSKRHEMTEHKEGLKEVLDEFEAAAGSYDTIEAFMAYIDDITDKYAAASREQKHGLNRNAISLMSIHKSKGLEFPVVFVIGASEGILPHSSALAADKHSDRSSIQTGIDTLTEALEEERRLAYVAVTRAQEELYISSPATYRGNPAELSRFIRSAFSKDCEADGDGETALAWLCTSDSCQVWQRIITYEDSQAEARSCPLCRSPMEQGTKLLPSKKN
ncbi:UvrD-helicase domain-containing protein [Paenibacillus alkaliterrae]|uniref:UvrD-helicase domain-containing protein n=1 Tax=Paenibacillus alkaliterrae TaxID=320909 RepID=UPI001F2F1905|nr:UvrD-helicase domain-containing protein [Paenibacillus alkaliterrae]MCF2938590.1 UvrD-helicase domain-containing protein [Paenibacillus alkaliterrae]